MDGASSCIKSAVRIDGKDYAPLPFKKKKETVFTKGVNIRCAECNILPGGFHHVGCVFEICPKCGGKWIYCKCSGFKVRDDGKPKRKCDIIQFRKKMKSEDKQF
jgi:hypothetical protein